VRQQTSQIVPSTCVDVRSESALIRLLATVRAE
jgi:hypothetical protein